MLKIRLQRVGRKNVPNFRVVLTESQNSTKSGKYLEILGNYDPVHKTKALDGERIKYWISKGAQISPTVNNLMVNYKVWDRPKMQSWKPKTTEVQKSKETHKKTESTEKEQKKTEIETVETQERMEIQQQTAGESKVEAQPVQEVVSITSGA